MTLHPAAHATCKTTEHLLILVTNTTTDRHHVTRPAIFRIYRTEHVIEQRSFFEFRVTNIRMNRKKAPRHLEQVVNVAAFISAPVDTLAELVRWTKVLVLSMPTRGIAVIVDYRIPKELSSDAIGLIA